jgi:hypothetical protein
VCESACHRRKINVAVPEGKLGQWSFVDIKLLAGFGLLCPSAQLRERNLVSFLMLFARVIAKLVLTKDMIAAPSIVIPRANATFLFDALRMFSLNLKRQTQGRGQPVFYK